MLALGMLHVPLNRLRVDGANCPVEVPACPELVTPQVTDDNVAMMLAHHATRKSLQQLRDLSGAVVLACHGKHVAVIAAKAYRGYGYPVLPRCREDVIACQCLYRGVFEYRSPVGGRYLDVVVGFANAVARPD